MVFVLTAMLVVFLVKKMNIEHCGGHKDFSDEA